MFPDFLPNIVAAIEFGDRCIDLIKHHFMEENICNDSETIDSCSDFSEVEREIFGGRVFADLMSDAGLKTIFTSKDNEGLLVELINVMLQGERRVTGIRLKPTEYVPNSIGGKTSIVDLCAVDEDGASFDIEVQRCSEDDLFKRFMGYASRIYYENVRRGGESGDLKPVYVIVLLDGKPETEDGISYAQRLYSFYTMMEKFTHEVAPSTICVIFAALGYFDKMPEQCVTDLDRWCYMFRHMGQMTEIPEWVRDKVMLRLFRAARIAGFNREQKHLYVRIMMEDFRTKGMLKAALRKGREAGKIEGQTEALTKTAVNMLRKGIPSEIVAECTGLDLQTIAGLLS